MKRKKAEKGTAIAGTDTPAVRDTTGITEEKLALQEPVIELMSRPCYIRYFLLCSIPVFIKLLSIAYQ